MSGFGGLLPTVGGDYLSLFNTDGTGFGVTGESPIFKNAVLSTELNGL